jgi:hypothetical protein
MPRKLKVYQTSMACDDLSIATPSMKTSLEAWGSNMTFFHPRRGNERQRNRRACNGNPGDVLQRAYGIKETREISGEQQKRDLLRAVALLKCLRQDFAI